MSMTVSRKLVFGKMTRRNQGRRWCVCLFVTAAASVKSQPYGDSYHGISGGVSGGGQTRYSPVSLCCFRGGGGGSCSPFPREQPRPPPPPPPPPRPPPPRPPPQALEEEKDKQQQQQGGQWSGRRIESPRRLQPSCTGELSLEERPQPPPRLSHAPQRPDCSLKRLSPTLSSPPSHLDSESRQAARRPPPPPPCQNHLSHHFSKIPPAPPVSRKVATRSQVQLEIGRRTPESKRKDSATIHDTVFVPRPDDSSQSVGHSPFVPLPDDGNVFVGDTQNTPFVLRPNGDSASVGDTRSSPYSMDASNPIDNHLDTNHQSSPSSMNSNPIDKHLHIDIQTVPPQHGFKALGTADFILVSPENADPLDRISLKTGIRPREARQESTFGNLVHFRHELVLEQLLQSQESIREEMMVITQLLRALLAVQVRHADSLVLHVPRQLAHIAAPRITRRRVEKRRNIPRTTILSSLENLDRDLSDGEFNVLLDGLMQPSEVEEVYHEYEYDQEDFLPQDVHRPIHVTSNQEEFNEFLRETSDSETAEQYYEQDQYDSDYSYDYYDEEPLEELRDVDSLTDVAVGGLTKDEIIYSDKEDVKMSETDPGDGFSFELASKEKHVPNDDAGEVAQATSSQLNDGSAANEPQDSITRASMSASRRPPPLPPPPPPHHHSTKGQSNRRSDENERHQSVHCTSPANARVRRANGGLKKPPPPPPRVPPHPDRMTPLPPLSKLSPEVGYEHEESEWSDQSDYLDQEELRLLEDTAINEIDDRMRHDEEEFEDYDESIDEDDLRILQLSRWMPSHGGKRSRWMPFVGRKKQSFDDDDDKEEDLLVDEAVYLDEALYDAMTSEDFTDIEGETPSLAASKVVDEESREESTEDDMILGESAVADIPGYTEGHFGGSKLNSNAPLAQHGNGHFSLLPPPPPPPPRPPPRQVLEHDTSKMHSAMQQPHVQQVVPPQLASATGQSTHYQVYPPYSSQQHEQHDRRTSRAPASLSPHGTRYPNTRTNPPSHNPRHTGHSNADAEQSPYKR